MEGRCDGSAVAESSLPERTGSDACGRPGATDGQILQAASGAARKIPGEETEEAADQRTHGSDLQRAENSTMNPGRVFPLDGLPGSQKRSLGVSKGDSLCLEAPGSVGGDPVFLDYPGGEAAPCKHQTDLQLRPPEDQTDPERRSGESRKENICSSVLRQLLQQQKHKPGRKHKKKTLMKMARLLVIAKGWDRRENQTLSLEEESDLKEEIFTSLRRKQTSRNLSQPSDLHPNEKESGQISSESAGEETRIPPESREAAPKPTSRRRKKAAKAPKAAGKKEDPSDETSGGSGSDSTHKNKEESPQTDPTAGKDPELRFRKKTVQKRTLGPSETERLSVSPGRKRTRRMGSVTHIQPAPTAAEADTGLSSQTGSSGFAGNIAAQETQPQESKKEPREGRNPSAEQLPAALQDQTKREEKVSPSDVFLKLNPGRRGAKTTTSPTTASVWDQLPSAEASNTQHETGMKDSNMRQQRAAPNTETFPVREERSDWDVMRGTLSRKQDEDPVRSRKKPKGRGWRKKITEQTLNFQTKTKLVGEAPAHQLDFPLMVTTAASREKQPDRRREPRKRKHTEDDDASRSVEVTTPGSAGDEAGGSRKMENRELHVSDELDEGSACRKIRRSCTLGIKTSSAVEELLIRFLKGSRRRASSKRSNGKAEGIPEGAELLGKDEQLPENGTKFKPTKRGREKTVGLSADGEAVPGNDPTLPGSALGSNQQKEVKMRRKKGNGQKTEDIPASGGQTGASPEPNRMNLLRIEGTSALKEDFLGVRTKRRKTGRKRRRVLKKDMRAGPKVLDPEEERPHEGGPGAPEDGEPSSVRRGQKRKVLTIKMEDKASCLMEVEANQEPETEKSQLMSSFQGKSNATETGSHTRAGPDSRGKMNLLQMEGVPTDPNGDSAEVFSKVRGWTQRRTVQKVPRGHKVLESNEDRSSEQDTGAPDDGKICATSNISRGRKKEVLTIKWEDEKSCFMEVEANQEPGRKKPFQESVSSAATTRKRRRRSKTHWTGDRKAKRPPVRSFCDVPTISSSCDETVNVRHGNQENRMMTNVPSGPGTRRRLQKEERKNLRCSFCLRSFRHISALTLHKRLHTGRKPYGCSVCTKSFSKISQLKLHLKLHGELPATRCPCCEETFRDKAELIRHLKVHLMEVERLQTELGRSRRSRSTADQDKTFRCPVCSKEFTKKSAFENHRRIHGKRPLGCWKTFRGSGKIRGFLVSEVGDAAVVTPLFFKCPICQRIHRHWCHYVLHLQSHASRRPHSCGACRQEYGRAAGGRRHCSVCCRASGAETACRGSLQDIWKEAGASGSPSPDAELSAFPEGEGGGKLIPPASSGDSSPSVIEDLDFDILSPNSGFSDPTLNHVSRFPPEPPRLSVRSWCGRFGGAPSHWSKRGPRRPRAFRCSRCELDFHFLGSYMDHLQEHAAETPHACPSCRGTFSHEAQPESPVSSRRRQPHAVKCSTCGKLFSTARNLRKHKLLHTGGRSHSCLPCSRSFSCHSALKAHLETHRRRLSVPQPARVAEPFLFPYPCRRCSARFSSTELLEAHQVCHFIAGRKPESPPESILSFIPSLQTAAVSSSGPKRKLPVSNRKDLFRYPHPDRLYVVPAVSSEPPVVVPLQEAGESPPRSPISAELQLQLLVKSLVPEKRLAASDSSDSEGEATMRRASCAICTQSFADVSTLHEHYRNHARGM